MKGVKKLVQVGCGSYACTYIMPNVPRSFERMVCIDPNPVVLHNFKKRFNFKKSYSFASDYTDKDPCIVVVASYHSDHISTVRHFVSLNPSNWIFIEKPPVINLVEAQELAKLRCDSKGRIYIGFNRPHSKLWNKIGNQISLRSFKLGVFSIKEVGLLKNHWYFYDANPSRVVGNLVHWIDLALLILGEENCSVVSFYLNTKNNKETVIFTLANSDGQSVVICASDYGDSLRGVYETIELRSETKTYIIDDFRYLRKASSFFRSKYYFGRDKGHSKMYLEYFEDVRKNNFNGLNSYSNARLIALYQIVEQLKRNYDNYIDK